MKRYHIIITLALIIFIGLLYISLRVFEFNNTPLGFEKNDRIPSNNIQNQQIDNTNPQDTTSPDVFQNQESGGGSSTSLGGGSQGSNPPLTSPDCDLIIISHSLRDFLEDITCNSYQGSDCIDKTINCSVSIKNLDNIAGGEFEIIFNHVITDTQEIYSTNSQTKEVQARATEKFTDSIRVLGAEANEEFTCKFEKGNSPKKEVCS